MYDPTHEFICAQKKVPVSHSCLVHVCGCEQMYGLVMCKTVKGPITKKNGFVYVRLRRVHLNSHKSMFNACLTIYRPSKK